MKRTHVVHIITGMTFGGAQRFIVDQINAVSSKEYKFSIISFQPDNRMVEQIDHRKKNLYVIPKKGKLSLHLFREVRKLLQSIQPDIVHTHLFGGDVWGRRAAHTLGIPIVTTEHNTNFAYGAIRNIVKKKTSAYATAHVAVSEAIGKYAMKEYGIAQMEVIHPGIDLAKFSSLTRSSKSEKVRILMLGRLNKQKGYDRALEALAKIPQKLWHATIVGEGEDKDALVATANTLGIVASVTIAPPTHDVPRCMQEHDLFLMPSRWEGLGVVVMEAMAAGLPVIASRVGGIPELIRNKKTGLLVDPKSVPALCKAIETLIADANTRSAFAKAAQAYAIESFGVAPMVDAYDAVYQKILK